MSKKPMRAGTGLLFKPANQGCVLPAIVLLGLAGCSEHVRVRSYWATTLERMPACSSYAWFSEANVTTATLADPALHAFIQQEIEAALRELGYALQPGDGEADFLISYRSSMGVESTSWGPATKGLLAIQAHRPDGRVIWRGWVEEEVDSSATPETRRERLGHLIHRILAEFYPE